jgi:hypothetical protein
MLVSEFDAAKIVHICLIKHGSLTGTAKIFWV